MSPIDFWRCRLFGRHREAEFSVDNISRMLDQPHDRKSRNAFPTADSPTTPNTSPSLTVKETPFTAVHRSLRQPKFSLETFDF